MKRSRLPFKKFIVTILITILLMHTKNISQVTVADLEGLCVDVGKTGGAIQILQQLLVYQNAFAGELDGENRSKKGKDNTTKGILDNLIIQEQQNQEAALSLQADLEETLGRIIDSQIDSKEKLGFGHVTTDDILDILLSLTKEAQLSEQLVQCLLDTEFLECPADTCCNVLPEQFKKDNSIKKIGE